MNARKPNRKPDEKPDRKPDKKPNKAKPGVGEIIRKHLAQDDALGWFEELYAAAAGDPCFVPWVHLRPRQRLLTWIDRARPDGRGKRALVVGCGLGDDAEAIAALGYRVTAFDISPTAIRWCQERFPNSRVRYQVADLFHPPPEWLEAFDLVVEAYTIQALPPLIRVDATLGIARFLAPGGRLVLIAQGIDSVEGRTGPPWPLTPEEVRLFRHCGLEEIFFQAHPQEDGGRLLRFLAEFRRPATG